MGLKERFNDYKNFYNHFGMDYMIDNITISSAL